MATEVELFEYFDIPTRERIRGIIDTNGAAGITLGGRAVTSYSTDSSGNVTGLVGPGGGVALHMNVGQRTLLAIGDSRTGQGIIQATAADITGTRLNNHGWQNWYRSLSQRRHRVINAGRSGRTALQLATSDTSVSPLDSLQVSVINPAAQDALIWIGTNDIDAGYTGASVCTSIRTIAATARSSGKSVAVIVETPRTNFSSAKQRELFELQRLLYKYSAYGEFGLIDPNPRLTDWSNTTNYYSLTGLLYDSTHPNAAGAKIIAEEVNAYYSALYPSAPAFFQHHYTDDSSSYSAASNRIANGMFASSLTGWTGPSVTGAVTASTPSRIAAPDGYGFAYACDITVNAPISVSIMSRNYDAGTGFVAGDTLQASARYWIQGNGGTGTHTGVVGPYLRCDINTTGGAGAGRVSDLWSENSTNEFSQPTNFEGTLETVPYYFTGLEGNLGTTFQAGIRFSGAGSARIIFARPVVAKNTATFEDGGWIVSA